MPTVFSKVPNYSREKGIVFSGLDFFAVSVFHYTCNDLFLPLWDVELQSSCPVAFKHRCINIWRVLQNKATFCTRSKYFCTTNQMV